MRPNLLPLFLAVAASLFFTSCDSSEISGIFPEPASPRPLLAEAGTPSEEDLDPTVPSRLPVVEDTAPESSEPVTEETETVPLELTGDKEIETKAGESELFHGPPDPVIFPVAAQIEAEPAAGESADPGFDSAETPEIPEDFSLFYEELASMGEWFETDEYGFVWQPAIAQNDPKWRPYTLGRWVDSDQGWAWISEEPFGWATYHYGRWALLEVTGWVWVPGEIWAPSWVAWRRSEEYIGWAPLPPETLYGGNAEYGPGVDLDYGISPSSYTFMPVGYFDEPVYSYCEPPPFSLSYIPHTINVTHIRVGPSHVNCGGPKREFIRRSLGRDLKCYAVKCAPDWNRHAHGTKEHYRPRFGKDTIWICAPTVKAPWNAKLRPGSTVKKIEKPVVVRRTDWAKAPNVKKQFANARRTRAFLANHTTKPKPVVKSQDHSAVETAIRNAAQGHWPPSLNTRLPNHPDLPKRDPRAVLERNAKAQQMALSGATDRGEVVPIRQTPPEQNHTLTAAETAKRAEAQSAAKRNQRAEAEASRRADAERQRAAAEKIARQQQLAAAEAEKRGAMQRTAREHQQAEADAARKAEADRQRAQAEKAAREKQLAAAEAEKRAAMQRASEEHRRAEAEASRRAEEERQRAAAEKTARQQQLAAAEAEKRAAMQRTARELQQAEVDAARKAAAEKAAREKQQRDATAAAQSSRRAEADRRRAAAERAAREHQRAEAESSRKAEAERQRALAEKAAREQQRATAEAEKRAAMQRAAQEHQRAEAEASRKADAERQRVAAEQAAREKQRTAVEAEKRAAMQRAAQEHQRAEAEASRKAQADRQRGEAQQAAREQQQRAATAAAESAKREAAARQRVAAERAARERAAAQRQREAQQRARVQAQRSKNNNNKNNGNGNSNRGSGKRKR